MRILRNEGVENMKITLIQVNNNIIGISNRLQYIEEQIQKIGKTDFVVLTELSSSGYIPNKKIWKYAEVDGEITKKWAVEMARKYNIYIGAGFVEKSGNDIYNSYLLANSSSVLGIIRKSEPESNIFKRGNFGHIVETPLGKIAISICLDSHKRSFYESIKNEEIAMILMPHAWATNKERETEDKQKTLTLVSAYGNAFDCPVIFANAVGEVEQMAGMTGKLMNPQHYKLNGYSIIFVDGRTTDFASQRENLSIECDVKAKKRKKDITFYGEWIDKGSVLFRNVVIPLDVRRGIKMYNKSKESHFEK